MKKTNLITLLLIAVLISLSSTGIAGVVDYEELYKRKLAVELLDETGDTVARNFNTAFQQIVKENWKLNSAVEFKTTSEIASLNEKQDKDYTLLYFSETSKGELGDFDNSGLKISHITLNYSRAEQPLRKADYLLLSPEFIRKRRILEHNILFTINFIQKNIQERVKAGKNISPKKFATIETEKNCGKLKDTKLLIDRSLLKKGVTSSKLREKYSGKFKTVKATDIMPLVKAEKVSYTVVLPTGLATSSASATVGMTATEVIRMVVTSDGEVLGCAGISAMYKSIDKTYSLKDFKIFSNCK